TLLELAGLPPTVGIRGKSLLKAGSGDSPGQYAEAPNMRSLRSEGWKLIDKLGSTTDELYHLQEDPAETKNLVTEHPQIAAKMRAQMDRLAQAREPAPSAGRER
ncbi:MAG: hypothetical protein GTN65_11255, partial [Armatimonadetes bacterium]|nr:hypothetical protein [Armatimonadota bacterium]NIO97644.1 hypothetical protein [Armatimonadota bacterium]